MICNYKGNCNLVSAALGLSASAIDSRAPDCAGGTRIGATRWLYPGYDLTFIEHSA